MLNLDIFLVTALMLPVVDL